MKSANYGYVRVSTRDQNEDRQKIAMQQFGIARSSFHAEQRNDDIDIDCVG